jgi:predicted RNase H-like nuclease (RuvC/YqgF family)
MTGRKIKPAKKEKTPEEINEIMHSRISLQEEEISKLEKKNKNLENKNFFLSKTVEESEKTIADLRDELRVFHKFTKTDLSQIQTKQAGIYNAVIEIRAAEELAVSTAFAMQKVSAALVEIGLDFNK